MKTSWRTTAAGAIAIVVAVLGVAGAMIDGDDKTQPDWASFGAAVMAGVGLLAARDNKVSSEDAGAK
jgi:hypothetical protein